MLISFHIRKFAARDLRPQRSLLPQCVFANFVQPLNILLMRYVAVRLRQRHFVLAATSLRILAYYYFSAGTSVSRKKFMLRQQCK
jgi:hypothetical protein